MNTQDRPEYPMYYLGRHRKHYVRKYAPARVSPIDFMPFPFAR